MYAWTQVECMLYNQLMQKKRFEQDAHCLQRR